jgi:hypothetical protein
MFQPFRCKHYLCYYGFLKLTYLRKTLIIVASPYAIVAYIVIKLRTIINSPFSAWDKLYCLSLRLLKLFIDTLNILTILLHVDVIRVNIWFFGFTERAC